MLCFLKKKFMDLKIRWKIALSMMFLALLSALIAGIFCSVSFELLYREQNKAQTEIRWTPPFYRCAAI